MARVYYDGDADLADLAGEIAPPADDPPPALSGARSRSAESSRLE